MLKIVFCRNGELVSDFEAYDFADRKIAEYKANGANDMEVRVSNECAFSALELRVFEKKLAHEDVQFYLEDALLHCDRYKGIKIPDGTNAFCRNTEICKKIMAIALTNMLEDANKTH